MDSFKKIETELDELFKELPVWNLSFQTIISTLLITVECIDLKQNKDTAMDYISRLSYLYPNIEKFAAKKKVTTTTHSILGSQEYLQYFDFLSGYGHFSMLMPQVHRKMFAISQLDKKSFYLKYADEITEHAEIIDRLYSYLSQEIIINYPNNILNEYVKQKVKSGFWATNEIDDELIRDIFVHYKRNSLIVKPLPDQVLINTLGFSYEDYYSFCAAGRALSDWQMALARAFYAEAIKSVDDEELADKLMSEYFEYSVCCYKNIGFELNRKLAGLSENIFNKILSFYLTVYEQPTNKVIKSNSVCGDGYFPPFIVMGDSFIYGLHCTKYMLTLNNILYSANNNPEIKKTFDNLISGQLEPVLINQLIYLFSNLTDLKIIPNINYAGGEMDLLIVSDKEKFAICIQAKATIAPDSGRTVKRVEDRSIEGINQIKHFERFTEKEKLNIINNAAGTSLDTVVLENLLVVRSCAGSKKIWHYNDKYPIINYILLASIIADKLQEQVFTISDIIPRIKSAQQELVSKSAGSIDYETLTIHDYQIKFPFVFNKSDYLFSLILKCEKFLPLYTQASF